MINLKTFYPYTNESIEEIQEKLEDSNFEGIVLPVIVEEGREDSFRILKQKSFNGEFTCAGSILIDFLRKINLENKQVLLTIIDLFNDLSNESILPHEISNYEILRKALKEVYGLVPNITINNNLYSQVAARKDFFSKLEQEFPGINSIYTMFNHFEDITECQNIVPINMDLYDIVSYINKGKKIYLPQFESKLFARQFRLEELLKYYRPGKLGTTEISFNQADITVITRENVHKLLEKRM